MALLLASRDPVFFVNEFVWTYDPREENPFIPFDLYPEQEEALRWLLDLADRGVDAILDKSRDVGATWLTSAFAVWMWLFRPGAAVGFGSRKLELVDKIGDPKSIFDKIRTIIRNLPPWIMQARAPGYDPKLHDNFCKIINPNSKATITGEGGNEIGRGGRTTIYFVDESAFLARPQLVDQSLTANSRCRIDVSTPHGGNNPFAVKRLSGKYPVKSLHWQGDPRKTNWAIVPFDWEGIIDSDGDLELGEDVLDYGLSKLPEAGEQVLDNYGLAHPPEPPDGYKIIYPWYEEIDLKEDPITVAQEYNIDYSASLEGVIIPARWLRAAVGLSLPDGAPFAGFDVAAGGSAENVYIRRNGPNVKRIVRWRQDDPTDATFKVIGYAEADQVKRLFFDAIGVGAGVGGAMKLARRALTFAWTGINVGESPTATIWPDRMKSKEKFANLKAELWWRLRVRAERTYQYAVLGISHKPEDLLSFPPGSDTEALISQLSGVVYHEQETGKIIVESKKELRDRGVASPDLAEALVLSFAPVSISTRATRSGSSRSSSPAPESSANPKWAGKVAAPFQLIDPKKPRLPRGRRGHSA